MNRRILLQTATALAAVSTGTSALAQNSGPPTEHTGADALLFQNDPEFWYETVRLFGAAEYGGALFGEVVAIAQQIEAGDYDSWYDANSASLTASLPRPRQNERRGTGSAPATASYMPAIIIEAPNSSCTPIRMIRA